MKAINLFNNWASSGKDDGMVINHTPSVNHMFSLIPNTILSKNFAFLDIGCGNGWVVRRISKINQCVLSVGIDGAKKMIEKAILKDKKSEYLQLDINDLKNYQKKFDIIFSMEVFYYLKNPQETMKYVFSHLLKKGGCFVIGIDHYLENTKSLAWKNDLNVDMCTYSISEWKKILKKTGFSNTNISQFGEKKDWKGTLILYGQK